MRYYPCTGAYRTKKRSVPARHVRKKADEVQLRHFLLFNEQRSGSAFFRLGRACWWKSGGRKARYCSILQVSLFQPIFSKIHSSVATRDPRFPPSGRSCRNCDSAFPCSKGRDIHIYIVCFRGCGFQFLTNTSQPVTPRKPGRPAAILAVCNQNTPCNCV
jgi:hypothetical protein